MYICDDPPLRGRKHLRFEREGCHTYVVWNMLQPFLTDSSKKKLIWQSRAQHNLWSCEFLQFTYPGSALMVHVQLSKPPWGPFTDSVVFMMQFISVSYTLGLVRWITSKYLLTVLIKSPLTIHRPDTTWDRHLCQTHRMLGQVSSTHQVGFDLHKDSLKIPFDLVVPDFLWL